jgi:DNA-binding HxlR family transcriptional regulator
MTRPRPSSALPPEARSACPIACTLDVVGDRWTLLIIRDLALGKTRFGEFLESQEKITTNILAERLARLETAGIITTSPYQQNPVRYAYMLTAKGRELAPLLATLGRWGKRHIAGTVIPPAMAAIMRKVA